MNAFKIRSLPSNNHLEMKFGLVTHASAESWQIDHTQQARRAFSCLVQPCVADQVLYVVASQQYLILAVMFRPHSQGSQQGDNNLSLPHQQAMKLSAQQITLQAQQQLHMQSLGDMSVSAPLGKISLCARDLLHTAQQSIMQLCRQLMSKAEYMEHSASQLAKTHGRHQIITAEKEMKIDADRINMG